MDDLVLKPERPKITITITSDDGTEHDHQFEVLPLTKPRYDATMRFAKKGAEMERTLRAAAEAGEDVPDNDYGGMLAEFCDQRVRSTNGPVTIAGLWADGSLPLAWVRRVGEYLQQEAVGDPPA
jgi:hypothetical protein